MTIKILQKSQPLYDDGKWLATTLGEVISRFEGPDMLAVVEDIRQACIERRKGVDNALDLPALYARVDALPLSTAATVARAFTLYFFLVNTAEQVHRLRRRASYRHPEAPDQPASPAWAFRQLAQQGKTAAEVREVLAQLEVRPVLTAHPTEATRRTVLSLQARIAQALLRRSDAPSSEAHALEQQVAADIEVLWLTADRLHDRPSVSHEISTGIWYLRDRLLPASERLHDVVAHAFEATFGEPLDHHVGVVSGSWMGGDRDGNPYVTPEVTVSAARRGAITMLEHYLERVTALVERLSISQSLREAPEELIAAIEAHRVQRPDVFEAYQRLWPDEPVRLAVLFVRAHLWSTRARLSAAEAEDSPPADLGYPHPAAFLQDLECVARALEAAGAHKARRFLLEPLIDQVRAQGFAGFLLDVREDAQVHTDTLNEVCRLVGLPALQGDDLTREVLGRRPLVSARLPLSDSAKKCLAVFDAVGSVQAELSERAASTYIISMCKSKDDLLRVLLLAREAGLLDLAAETPWSRLDIVPLFETGEDLDNAADVLEQLFTSEVYRRQLVARGHRQEVMLGYSDSAKDVGVLPAAWALYEAQERLARVAESHGVALTMFHGRGGTVGRGGGSPVYRALSALPPGTVTGAIKITEQGEVISQKFGILEIAERSLEVMLTGTLLATFADWRQTVAPARVNDYRDVMRRLSDLARPFFRALVHEDPALFEVFIAHTPVRELAHVHFGSRPAYRERGAGTMKGIRAIPWNFGWTQIRLMLPGWLGVGTALEALMAEEGGLETLQTMARDWPFFDDLIGKVEMVLAKSDIEVARLYLETMGASAEMVEQLLEEHQRTVRAIEHIRGTEVLLSGNPTLRAAIAFRNPYVDPLSLLQLSLLKRKRTGTFSAEEETILNQALGTTLNGVAQGLRNTG